VDPSLSTVSAFVFSFVTVSPAFIVVILMLAPSTAIAVVVLVPAMVVLKAPVGALPIACEVACAVMMRRNPNRALVWRSSPIALMPVITPLLWIPVALDPYKLWPRSQR